MNIKCPYCGCEIEHTGDIDGYDWDGSFGSDEFSCPECYSVIGLNVEAKITSVEVERLGESQKFLDELYSQEQEAKYDMAKEEGLL